MSDSICYIYNWLKCMVQVDTYIDIYFMHGADGDVNGMNLSLLQ